MAVVPEIEWGTIGNIEPSLSLPRANISVLFCLLILCEITETGIKFAQVISHPGGFSFRVVIPRDSLPWGWELIER